MCLCAPHFLAHCYATDIYIYVRGAGVVMGKGGRWGFHVIKLFFILVNFLAT